MTGKRLPLSGTKLVIIGICTMVAGTIGTIWLTVVVLPLAGRLGGASPACLLGYCSDADLYRALVAVYLIIVIVGIGLMLAGGRLREMGIRPRAEEDQS